MLNTLPNQGFDADLREIERLVHTRAERWGHEKDQLEEASKHRDYAQAVFRRYQDEFWIFVVFPALAFQIKRAIRETRRGLLRAIPGYTKASLDECKGLLSLWISLCGPVRQRAEYFVHQGIQTAELHLLLDKLADLTAEAKLTLAQWVEQSPSLSPAMLVRPLPGTENDAARG